MKKHSLTLIDMSINCDSFLKKEDRLKYLGLHLLIFEIRITVLTLQFHSYHQKFSVFLVIKISPNLGSNNKTVLKCSSTRGSM